MGEHSMKIEFKIIAYEKMEWIFVNTVRNFFVLCKVVEFIEQLSNCQL
jgi:hypothetical protein